MILEIETGNTRLHSVENTLSKRLWTFGPVVRQQNDDDYSVLTY
jgi:hypothetical protein